MKLFKIKAGHPVDQIVISDLSEFHLVLGEEGRGRNLVKIPIIGSGDHFRAKKTEEGIVLYASTETSEEKGRCLVIIDTDGGYSRTRHYDLHNISGEITIVAQGLHAEGIAGRVNSSPEYLAIASPNLEFRLKTKYASVWYSWDGRNWSMYTQEERKAQLALELAEKGEGEWL